MPTIVFRGGHAELIQFSKDMMKEGYDALPSHTSGRPVNACQLGVGRRGDLVSLNWLLDFVVYITDACVGYVVGSKGSWGA